MSFKATNLKQFMLFKTHEQHTGNIKFRVTFWSLL